MDLEAIFSKSFFISKIKKKIIISPIGALEPWSVSQKNKKKLAWYFYQKILYCR